MFDLVLKGGRVVDPAAGRDGVMDVAFAGGKVAAIGSGLEARGAEIRDCAGLIVTPGLIDLHTHVYWGGTALSVDPESIARRSGVSTFVDAGSAGAGNFPGFRRHVIEAIAPRILAYVNISFAGIFGFSKNVMVGECGDMRLIHPGECVDAIEANRDIIVGVKARIGGKAGGASGIAPLEIAMEVADRTGLPLMAHIDVRPPDPKEVVQMLRPGDILTHCFRPWPHAPMRAAGDIRAEILAAKERGVIFDIGHGMGGFSFASCRAMLDQGLTPDTISSDVHVLCVDGPAFDLLACMSKFMALGLSFEDVLTRVTQNPARALRRPDLGTLRPGGVGDATILDLRDAPSHHVDVEGEKIEGRHTLVHRGLVIGGRVWCDGAEPAGLPGG